VFSTLELQYDIYALTAGLRQDRYGIRGHIPVCSDVPGQCAEINGGGIDVRRTQRALSPSLAVSWQATDWLQLFAEVSRTSRPPRCRRCSSRRSAGRHERCRRRGRQPVPAP
jgi:hemoglobin/transferrin/lactoferrin receptor protein